LSGLYALVLAAGKGARFGGRKLLSPWRGGALLDGALAVALAAPVEAVVLVTGSDADEVAAAGRDFAARRGRNERLTVVTAHDFAEGLSASLRAGLAALPGDAAGVLVFLGDMPVVPPDIAPKLACALADGASAAAPVHKGRRGHPVAFSRMLFPDLAALTGDKGARGLLDRLGDGMALIQTESDGVLIDVDWPGQAPA